MSQQTARQDFAGRRHRDDGRVGGRVHRLFGAQRILLDKYNAYGEVPIPGSGSLHLPAGEVTVSLHTVVIGSPNGGGLPVPPLGVTISPPDGVAQPVVTEDIGSTTTVNNDAHVRVWVVQIAAAGTYNVMTDGQVNGFINPRLAFGYKSSYGYLVWVFVAMFVVGLIDLALSVKWMTAPGGRRRRRWWPESYFSAARPIEPQMVPVAATDTSPSVAREPTDEGVQARATRNAHGASGFRGSSRSGVRGRNAASSKDAEIHSPPSVCVCTPTRRYG